MRTTLSFLCFLGAAAVAQPIALPFHPIFSDTGIAAVRITIHPDSLARILDPANADSDHEYPATMVFENNQLHDTLTNIGFRLRGNTSRDSQKKSFKVSINTFESGRSYVGLEKLNLNGEHNDPTIVRAKVAWDIFQAAGIPASRASHARLFINGEYRGLYLNVEHIDEQFVQKRFGNNDGSLYKCLWPADLTYLGAGGNSYKSSSGGRRAYELHITEETDDYTDLARFISILNLTPDASFADSIHRVFDVNSLLRVLAVDIAAASWDNYWYLKNNFYLYHNTTTGLFEWIPYDYDNTFGIWWTGIQSGIDWTTRNIYAWGHATESRPLTKRILAVPEFRARLTFYLRRLVDTIYKDEVLYPLIDSLHDRITPAAVADSFRTLDYGFTVTQFHNSFTQPLGGHVLAGLKPFISNRRTSILSQLDATNVPPILSGLTHAPNAAQPSAPIAVHVFVEDEAAPTAVTLHGTINDSSFAAPMSDDGLSGDGSAGDGIYGVIIAAPPAGGTLTYYVEASDQAAQSSREPFGTRVRTIAGVTPAPRLLLNEFMAKNEATLLDPFGGKDDWVEVFNAESAPLHLSDFYLTDNLSNPTKWQFPDTMLASGGVLLVWADEEGAQGPLHANIKLDKDGEQLGIFYATGIGVVAVDTLTFGLQTTDVSMGRVPDGGTWQFISTPSPGSLNTTSGVERVASASPSTFRLEAPYPNPFNPSTTAVFSVDRTSVASVRVYDLFGRCVSELYDGVAQAGGSIRVTFNASPFASGTYLMVLTSEGRRVVQRIILLK